MTSSKKKRMSMLDNLAAAGAPSPTSMMTNNRALRSARDAVDGHRVWELDAESIVDDRPADRLDPEDVIDLRDAIEANGQTVPILVRRHPTEADRYLLVYGRRRLEAIRLSDKVSKVRALIASLDEKAAVQAQISENIARRDLSFIEKALFAKELVENGFGNQSQVAEVLTVTKSSISMAMAVVEMLGTDLIRAIGPAHGIGRPKWEALGKAIVEGSADSGHLCDVARDVYTNAALATVLDGAVTDPGDISVNAFEAVLKAVGPVTTRAQKASSPARQPRQKLVIAGTKAGALKRTKTGLSIELDEGKFADWVEAQAQDLIAELHARWQQRHGK
ncbi:plasmid partitioning protein RepB [Pseudophaeobacter sp.]|uniref:plasmid partitioning protein RepB n=1 Tax=Pseudophaeobacter sp. TaxID=1971739 RepID=UPI00405843D9